MATDARDATPDEAHEIGYTKGHTDGYREAVAEVRAAAHSSDPEPLSPGARTAFGALIERAVEAAADDLDLLVAAEVARTWLDPLPAQVQPENECAVLNRTTYPACAHPHTGVDAAARKVRQADKEALTSVVIDGVHAIAHSKSGPSNLEVAEFIAERALAAGFHR